MAVRAATRELIDTRLRNGQAFFASNRADGLANTNTTSLFIENGSSSGVDVIATQISVNGTGSADLDINFNVTQSSGGTALTKHNAKLGSSNSASVTTVESGGSYSGRATHPPIESVLSGGGPAGATVGAETSVGTIEIPPGNNMLLELTNSSGGANDYGIYIKWSEKDEG